MTLRPTRIAATLAGLTGAAFLVAAASPQPTTVAPQEGAEAAPAAADEEADPLHESMEAMQRNLKALRKLMRDPAKKDEALAAVHEMEAAVLVGLAHVPEPIEKLEGSALIAHDVAYKRLMASVYTTLLDMEIALDEGDADALKTLYRALGGQKKEGHQTYIDGK
ncbi:MAG: cytochrome b562 [Planctomycetota bacterium]|nr:cytochrome b562 [Planctomycetota bacterium]